MGRRVRGFAEGLAGQAVALVAAFAVDFAVGGDVPMLPTWLGLFVIGCAVPVYRHGRWGVAGVAAGWFGVTAALLIVDDPTDVGLYHTLGYFFIVWLFVILPVEALAVGAALIARNRNWLGDLGEGQRQASPIDGPARTTGWQAAQMSPAKRREPPKDG